MRVNHSSHVVVEGGHYLVKNLNDSGLHTAVHKILHHFEPDKTTPDNHRWGRFFGIDICLDALCIRDVSQIEDVVHIDAFKRRLEGFCSRGENDLVVAFSVTISCFEILYLDLPVLCIDCSDFGKNPYVYIVSIPERLGSAHQKLATILDHLSDIIGQPAVGKRNVRSSFK